MEKERGTLSIGLEFVSNISELVTEKPFEIYVSVDPKYPKSNLKFTLHGDIKIVDVRDYGTDKFKLERNGFGFIHHDFKDGLTLDKVIGEENDCTVLEYLQHLSPVLMSFTGAEKVILYDWRVSCAHHL